MSHNFTLSPEDHLLWQTRAPRASYWLGVSNHHPFIDGGRPVPLPEVTFPPYGTTLPPPGAIPPQFQTTIPPLGTILPPPPYTSIQPPTLPTSASQPYLAGSQPSMLGAAPFLPGNSVPIYNIRHQNRTPATAENPSSPSRFIVSVPLKRLSVQDLPSRAEIAFEWEILPGDFYDRVCARMDLDPKDAMLRYKFDIEAKKSIIHLRPDDPVAFSSMLEKVKSRIVRSRHRAVILEIHNLATKRTQSRITAKKKQVVDVTQPSLTIKQTRQLQLLKRKLQCAEGHRPWCWVALDGSHRAITIFQITLWAQMIADGTATLERPPTVKAFDYLPKRIQKEKKAASVPEIHLHLPARFEIGASSSTQVEEVPQVITDTDPDIDEVPPSAFKTEAGNHEWVF